MEEKTLSSEYVFRGKVVTLRVDEVEVASGKRASREIVEHPGAVGIIALTADTKVVLIRQYRKAVEEVIWEIPAGKLDPGEEPETCAGRELVEETGFRAQRVEKLSFFYTSPGFAGEALHLFLARDLIEGPQALEDDENIAFYLVPLLEALEMISSGEIKDAKTITGLLLAKSYLQGSSS